jgi:predicted site-specific integrase-resolvase
MQQDTISLPEAAARIGVAWPAAHRLCLTGALGPAMQVRARWRVTEAGVAAYIQRRKPAAAQPVPSAAHAPPPATQPETGQA